MTLVWPTIVSVLQAEQLVWKLVECQGFIVIYGTKGPFFFTWVYVMIHHRLFFFFSSRRRHTRFDCDWSSDVCSSDLSGTVLRKRTGGSRVHSDGAGSRRSIFAGKVGPSFSSTPSRSRCSCSSLGDRKSVV